MEWVEVQGKTVEIAVQAALEELGLSSPEEATIEILQEPKAGFLGIGGQEAIVKVTKRPPSKKRRRRRRRGRGGKHRGEAAGNEQQKPRKEERRKEPAMESKEQPKPDLEAQAAVARSFLEGLLEAFGLEGEVRTSIEDDVLSIAVVGDQTEALVGPKGSVMQAVLELTRTVIQRKTYGAPRMRIDIAGYGERRREALKIYSRKLAEKVLAEGGEIMLEPMNPADRKVVHDTIAEIEGVRSYSEGEEPHRSVIIAPEEEGTEEADDAE